MTTSLTNDTRNGQAVAARSAALRQRIAADAARFGMRRLGIALVDGDRDVAIDHHDGSIDGDDTTPLYHAASSGKHVTAAVILDLASRGPVALDGPIGAYLPGLPPAWRARRLRSLLHHSSGLPDYLMAQGDRDPPATADDFLAVCATLPEGVPEGRGWHYSNTNYILLGLIATAVTDRPCGRLMQDLLDRAGAGTARVCTPGWVRAVNARTVDRSIGDRAALERAVIGDGDVAFTTAAALAWMRWLMGQLGTGGAYAELSAPAPLLHGAAIPYGAGLFLDSVDGRRIVHHAGHFDGWTAMMYLNLDLNVGAFALCDLAPGNTRAIRAIALRAIEEQAPGATPLSLEPILPEDDLKTGIMAQVFRADAVPDLTCFAPSMHPGPGTRGILNFQAGGGPDTIELVERAVQAGRQMRRYRVHHADRIEHVSVGIDDNGLIDWAWPL